MWRLAVQPCTSLKSIDFHGNAKVLTTALKELPLVPLTKMFLNCVDGGDLTASLLSLSESSRFLHDFNYRGRFMEIDVLEHLARTAPELENACLILTHGVKRGPELVA